MSQSLVTEMLIMWLYTGNVIGRNSLSYTLILSLVYYLTSAMSRDAKFNLCDSEIVQASARLIVEFQVAYTIAYTASKLRLGR